MLHDCMRIIFRNGMYVVTISIPYDNKTVNLIIKYYRYFCIDSYIVENKEAYAIRNNSFLKIYMKELTCSHVSNNKIIFFILINAPQM